VSLLSITVSKESHINHAKSYYSPRIFKSVGLTGSSTSLYATGIYGVVRLVCVIIAMYYVVDRFGRRKMLMGGAAVMLVAMVCGQRSHFFRLLLTTVVVVHRSIHQNRRSGRR
jgi:MFS family permease